MKKEVENRELGVYNPEDYIKLSEYTDIDKLKMELERLWLILDDIDIGFDMYKHDSTRLLRFINDMHKRRFNGIIATDGYDLFVNKEK